VSEPLVCLSLTRAEAERLQSDGPRRDILVLAERLGAEVLYRESGTKSRGIRGKIFGPQIQHAWAASARASKHNVVFADGEHVGLPLLGFLALRRRRRTRVVMLCHLIDKPWKRRLLKLGTWLVPDGTLVVHSAVQQKVAQGAANRRWDVQLVPYQVDSEFWRPAEQPQNPRPLVVTAGSENRDYETLSGAAAGLDVDIRIAAGSHWAREQASVTTTPPNLEYIQRTLPFAELRKLYASADLVVVPLHPVTNQSGVTTLLEAMSMGKAVITSATPGQREIVSGPLIKDGSCDTAATADRGPRVFGLEHAETTGAYVPVHDAAALRAAILYLAANPEVRQRMGAAGRLVAEECFSVESFAERFAQVIDSAAAKHR